MAHNIEKSGFALKKEHERQSSVLARLYAGRLGMSEKAYKATLPEFPERPTDYPAFGLKIPLIIETRIPLLEAISLSDIPQCVSSYLRKRINRSAINEWGGDRYKMPTVPFSAWAQDGTKFTYLRPDVAREELLKAENNVYRAGRLVDGIAMWSVRPDMMKTIIWDLIGAQPSRDFAFVLSQMGGTNGLHAFSVDVATPASRTLILGREIRTLGRSV